MMLIPKFICLSDCDNIEGKNYIGSTMKSNSSSEFQSSFKLCNYSTKSMCLRYKSIGWE